MESLNLPTYSFNIKSSDKRKLIFDSSRKKLVVLTPEEWVRQNIIQFLIHEKNFPQSLIAVEIGISVNKLSRRCDIVTYNKKGKASMIIECKAPSVKITQKTFDQIAQYNINLKVDYLLVTNGINHFCCMINHKEKSYSFLKDIPKYNEID